MAYFVSALVGIITFKLFTISKFKEKIIELFRLLNNSLSTINSKQSDDAKQRILLQNSLSQLKCSFNILFWTIFICLPGIIFFYFYREEFENMNFILLTSLISLLTFFIGFRFKHNEK